MSTKELKKTVKSKKEDEKATTKTAVAASSVPKSGKKKLVVSHKNLPPEILEILKEKYPKGYSDVLMKVNKGNGLFFYAITLDTDEVDYLIKVDVKIDTEMEEVERALFGSNSDQDSDDDFASSDSGDANFDQAEGEDSDEQ